MKKRFSLFLSAFLVICVVINTLAYTEGKNLESVKAKNIMIDGDLSEWDTTRSLKINSSNQIIDQIEHWDGEKDCSMEIYSMWDSNNIYFAMKILDDTPLVYREGFPLDELDAIILFFSTNPDADPQRTEYEPTDWRIVQSADKFNESIDFFNFIDRSMIQDPKGWETRGEYGDEVVFDDYEAAIKDTDGGIIWESRIPLNELSNENIAMLTPKAGMSIGFDFSILDVDLPCPGIHSLRMQSSANLEGRERRPDMHFADGNPSLWGTLKFVE